MEIPRTMNATVLVAPHASSCRSARCPYPARRTSSSGERLRCLRDGPEDHPPGHAEHAAVRRVHLRPRVRGRRGAWATVDEFGWATGWSSKRTWAAAAARTAFAALHGLSELRQPKRGHRANGFTTNGGLAEYALNHINTLYRIPDHVSYEEAGVVMTAGSPLFGLEHAGGYFAGETVAVLGPGPIGLMALQLVQGAGRDPGDPHGDPRVAAGHRKGARGRRHRDSPRRPGGRGARGHRGARAPTSPSMRRRRRHLRPVDQDDQARRQGAPRRLLSRARHGRPRRRRAPEPHDLHGARRGRNQRGPAWRSSRRAASGQAARHPPVPALAGSTRLRGARAAHRGSHEGRVESVSGDGCACWLALLLARGRPGGAAAAFPTKPIELTVLFGAGSAADLLARKLAEIAAKELGQPVAVVNRTGAGGAIGYTYVKGQSPDGYALVWNSNSVSTAYHAGNMKLDYTAFAGVAQLTTEPCRSPSRRTRPGRTSASSSLTRERNPGKRAGRQLRPRELHPPRGGRAREPDRHSSSPTSRSAGSWPSRPCSGTRSRRACSCRRRS